MAGDNVGSIEYDAHISTDKLKRDAAEVDRISKKAGDDLADHTDSGANRAGESFKKFAKIAAIALVATGVAAAAFGVSATKAFIESENAIAQTEAVLKSTGQVAGVTSKMVTDLANSLQRQTRYSDETIRSAENMLLTFTNISKKTFPAATQAVLDMATAMGTDLQSTAIQVGKALQDPVLGATALQRVGVRLTESQKDLIKSLVASGDAAGAQAVILKELQTEFGGSAKAAGQTFAGRLDILKNQLGEVQEGIGALIVVGIGPLVSGLLNWYDNAGGVEGIMAKLTSTVNTIMPTLKQWGSNIAAVATQIATYLEPKLTALGNTLTTQVIPLLTKLWQEVLLPLVPVVGTLLVGAIGLAIDGLNIFLAAVTPLVGFLIDNKWAVLAFAAAFGTVALAMNFGAVVASFQASMASVNASFLATKALLTTPFILPALGTALIIGSLVAVYDQALKTLRAMDDLNKTIDQNSKSTDQAIARLQQLIKEGRAAGDAAKVQRAQKGLQSIADGYRASGGPVSAGKSYVVGETQPELFVPRTSGTIIPEVPGRSSGSNISVNLNMSGIMARSTADLRDVGKDILRAINQELTAKGQPAIGGIT